MNHPRLFLPTAFALLSVVVTACGGDDDKTQGPSLASVNIDPGAIQTYAQIAHASYEDSLEKAIALDAAIETFVKQPSQSSFDAARAAWLAAREPYLQTEAYRFYEGPIDNPQDGPEGMINAWPLDEAYIDYVAGNASAGIINDAQTPLDASTLMALNEQGGEENIATGYHAIEFLLYGQDFNNAGPGERPYTDYVTDGSATALNPQRRAQYLTTVSKLLVEHLTWLVNSWRADDASNYRRAFEQDSTQESLRKILTGLIVLSGFETGGERLQTALDSNDQEDEHSCFSDNTHRDMIQNIQGIANVWHGSYQRNDGSIVAGMSVREVVAKADGSLAARLDAEIASSLEKANALIPPFDQEIAPGNTKGHARIRELISALRKQSSSFEDVFRKFGLTIPAPQ